MSTFAIIVSEFNSEITEKLLNGAVTRLREHGIDDKQITIVRVPGAVEIPLIAKLLAKKETYHAIICLGAVIRGETSHYDYVCQQVSHGCQKVMLKYEVPVIFGVLTTENEEQAEARIDKGRDAADAAVKMVDVIASPSLRGTE